MESDDQDIFSEFRDPERRSLIQQIREKCPELSDIPAECYFPLWLSNIDRLRTFATSTDSDTLEGLLAGGSCIDHVGILAGAKHNTLNITPQKRRLDSSIVFEEDPSISLNEPDPCDENVVETVLNRDNKKCILTGNPRWGSTVSRIIPHKMNSNTARYAWGWLKLYWGVEQCETWKKQILGKDGYINTEQVINMITLSTQTHSYWQNSACAFRPISVTDDKMSMDLAFHWCPALDMSHSRLRRIPIESEPYPEYPNGFIHSPVPGVCLLDPLTEGEMKSGRIFTIKTDDAANKPLPSFELLELLWNLHRIRAMRGAADDTESDEDEDQVDLFSFRSRSPSRSPSPADINSVLQEDLDPYNHNRSITPRGSKTPSIASSPEDSDFVKVE